MKTKPSVLVIGAGMYVGGRGAGTDGTILPTLIQAKKNDLIGDISVAATRFQSIDALRTKLAELNRKLDFKAEIKGYPTSGSPDAEIYKKALGDIKRPACAVVVVPDHLHYQITSEVIRSGVHPLVVKPFTPLLAEAESLVNMAEEYGLYGAVEFHKRFDETNLLLRQSIRDNKLGELRYITVEYSQKRMMQTVFGDWVAETNIFQYLGVHYVDLIYFLTNATPLRVMATGQPSSDNSAGQSNFDSVQVVVEWQPSPKGPNFVSTIVTNWIDPNTTSAMSDQKITVVGTSGRYQIDQKNRGAQLVTETGGIEEINPYFSQIYLDADGKPGIHGYGPRCITQFIEDVVSIEDGELLVDDLIGNRPTFKDCLVSTAVIEAVNRSLANEGNWVGISEVDPSRT